MTDIKRIIRIYKAGNTFGAVYENEEGRKCSGFFRRNELMAHFVKENFTTKKYKKTLEVYLQANIGKRGGLHTVGKINLKSNTYHMWKQHPAAHEMVETFELGVTAGY